ncbi:MAG: hypothetical protein GXP42_12855 [Chloroflexi bacterium]|nr:hypothetical protein [Chloroflexota bacterium]
MAKMAKKLLFFAVFLLLTPLLAACQDAGAAGDASAATPTPAGQAYWDLVQQAEDAYARADFEQAMNLARQAASINPNDNTSWEIYRQAGVAAAADDYLSRLPTHRYRLPVDVFVRDQVNKSKDWFLIDVREPDEFAAGHIEGAINIPLRELMKRLNELPNSKTAPILLYCHSQKRATHALVILHELGYSKAYNLEGGYAAYETWIAQNPKPTPGPTPTPAPDEPDFGC